MLRQNFPRGCLDYFGILVLLGIVVVPLLYLEEDWRGARELTEAKARWQAAGYSINAADYYPPPVPDAQNLAALPVFQLEPDPKDTRNPKPRVDVRLRAATDEDTHGGPLVDYYQKKKQLPELVADAYAKNFPGKTPPASLLAQLEELYPIITDLRTAAPTHPEFRLKLDYGYVPAFNRPLGPIVDQLKLVKLVSYDAQLALHENQPQVAVDDSKVAFEVARGVGTDPSLVGGLVELGDCAIMRATIDGQVTKHAWNDAQLVSIQDELKHLDCLTLFQFDMRCQAAANSLPMYEWCKDQPSAADLIVSLTSGDPVEKNQGAQVLWHLWASGWWDMNAAKTANLMLRESACVDAKARLIDLKMREQLEVEVETAKELPGVLAPWNMLYAVSMGPLTESLEKFAQMQVQLDEDRIVCGLERYRLAHGTYPPTLDALVPACIDELPHDVMNGEGYHYRLNADGTFLLYSVGWNQVDDGGKVVPRENSPRSIDFEKGDSIWPMFVGR